ncbi:MAG: Y-family DNA polymerase [Planctomycetota bacterium]|jgi:protein ImuB
MARLACIELPAFPLQLLLHREKNWRGRPVAVVEQDKPQAKILWLNERAREQGILPGMRYAAGLALCGELCADVVSEKDIARGVAQVVQRLRTFGPDVEPCEEEPGLFWVGAGGLKRLNPSLEAWGFRIRSELKQAGFACGVVLGFSRFAVGALAKSLRGPRLVVFPDEASERAALQKVPLDRLRLDAAVRNDLRALGTVTVGDLLALPPVGLRERFGDEVHALHRLARGQEEIPVQPEEELEPLSEHFILDGDMDGETNVTRLLFLVKRMLDPLLERAAARREALAELFLEMKLERSATRVERLCPADPTLDARQLLDLVLLRLESEQLESGVIELRLGARGVKATRKQLELFAQKPKRDTEAAKRAFARLRAEFGERAVVFARLAEGHLPEACFTWTPMHDLPAAKPRLRKRTLVRRVQSEPRALPHRPRHEEDGWQLRGRSDAAVEKLVGPFVVSGGWWNRERCREYHFARTRKGEWLWVFRDPNRRRWYLQGEVE